MNQTVARIVEIMFQDVELSEEVQALKEEVERRLMGSRI